MYFGNNPFENVPQVEPEEALDLHTNGEVDIVDVRERSEWELGHIEGATLMPLSELERRWQELDVSRRLVCVCRIGERSLYAAAMLRQAGMDASNMEGGMMNWKYTGLPITPPGIVEGH